MGKSPHRRPCRGCEAGHGLGFEPAVAFQPILDMDRGGAVMAYEALVRGPDGQEAGWVLDQVPPGRLYALDSACRIAAVEEAVRLGLAATGAKLSVNVLPSAILDPATCMRTTLAAAERTGFPTGQLLFELSEQEKVADPRHLQRVIAGLRSMGFTVAIDDFGAGNAGLSLLADLTVDMVKLDMHLVRHCDADRRRRVILESITVACRALGIAVVAEGVETGAEYRTLRGIGIGLVQGFLFARPGFRHLPQAVLPEG
ncbi:EAL domain-containing protein [Paracraurococcus lichenis]|uniref:EAL domain-containing protein n=1 Tax=Paracraurococcus lichenis TaxID=3064888 RepID=A0ABT9DS34_9PROT|nr:EAL domain-containing protein [Paracraurococcus sp. LOR1-02]MDO9706707.1 EAL domain-containing protein [Paracraurococcus sp. LOR1-02]